MHKFLGLLILLAFSITGSFADELHPDKDTICQKQIMETGFKILNANNIQKRMTFFYNPNNKVKITTQSRGKRVVVYKGCLSYLDNEDELAALLSHQIAHLNDLRYGIFRRTAMSYNPRKYETKADRRAVDLMVKAGYNPVAYIIIMNKTASEPSGYWEANVMKHIGSQRIISLYEYIYQKYPYFIANNEYLKDPVYQSFLYDTIEERDSIRELRQKRVKLLHKKKLQEEKI